MAAPRVVNIRPGDGSADVALSTPFRFGLRDADTRVDLSSAYCYATFATASYDPERDAVPAADAVLTTAATSVVLSVFDDAAGAVNPANPCDQSVVLTLGGERLYRVEKGDVDDAPQEGVLYVTVPAQSPAQPYSAEAELDLAYVTPAGTYDYTTYADFVGVVFGVAYWPENTGVFLLFRDDGTKRVSVVGPAVDGVGTRTVSVDVVYDWSVRSVYSIHMDPTAHSREVRVLAAAPGGDEVLLAEISLDALNQFLPNTRMGRLTAESTPVGSVTLVLGLDGTDQGNYLDVYGFSIANFGRVLLAGGTCTADSAVSVTPTSGVYLDGRGGADAWVATGTFTEQLTEDALLLTATGAGGSYGREEPDLAAGEWLVVGRVSAANSLHTGSYDTGMGVLVEDGTKTYRLSLVDNFEVRAVGVADSAAAEDTASGYRFPSSVSDWQGSTAFTLLGSTSRNALRLFLEDDVAASLSLPYAAAGYAATSSTGVTFGMLDEGPSGDFAVEYLWVLPSAVFYESSESTFPEAQGWTRASSGAVRALPLGGPLTVDCRTPGSYDVYYVEDTTYDATSGVTVFLRAEVTGWSDAAGAVDPPRSEFGPLVAVSTGTVSAQVRFIAAEDGRTYVFLSANVADVRSVLAQNARGRALSAEIDLSVPHVYVLDVRPLQHIRLYVDYAQEPAINVDWPSTEALRETPPSVSAGAVVAFGSLLASSGVRCEYTWVRAGIGRGYDFEVSMRVSEETLQSSVYGSTARLLVDTLDED